MSNRALSPIADDTERLLGSAEVRQLLKISQSSLERRVREKAIPAPRKIGGKNVWRASEINAYGASLFADEVRALSVTSVDQLRPEEVEDTAFSLAARALSTRYTG
jgi:predicted DNA-binding transcriptional regulator AlpA